ncbi:threonylcarbamoyl-AMP synthase [Oscillospiraceae bacterium HV4-5-C5C]|nr:threonylcarbamoyl-AMP synthase [Oscillospiraceae bacterium HV4-5-C5C]
MVDQVKADCGLNTVILKADPAAPADRLRQQLERAAEALRAGLLVAFPTETVYGLGGNALLPDTVKRIYRAKGRPSDNPLIVHVSKIDEINPLISRWPRLALPLARKFMPGPLTLILPKSDLVPRAVSGGMDTVAVRIPSNPVANALLRQAGVPVAAPSANLSGRPSPTLAQHVYEDLAGRISYLVDGGPCTYGVESTVLDLASGPYPRILRPGAVTFEMIKDFLNQAQLMTEPETVWGPLLANEAGLNRVLPDGEHPRAPGMKYRHYAPLAPVIILEVRQVAELAAAMPNLKTLLALLEAEQEPEDHKGRQNAGAALRPGRSRTLCALLARAEAAAWPGQLQSSDNRLWDCQVSGFAEDHSGQAAAHDLFAAFRRFDQVGAAAIVAQIQPDNSLGRAYMNRLGKAASYRVSSKGIWCKDKQLGWVQVKAGEHLPAAAGKDGSLL